MESLARISTAVGSAQPVGRHKIPAAQSDNAVSVLETLSPEMAREIGQAFSLATIGRRPLPQKRREDRAGGAREGLLKLASRVAAFVTVSAIAVLLTVAALYLMRLS
jgi:hypothetical protein